MFNPQDKPSQTSNWSQGLRLKPMPNHRLQTRVIPALYQRARNTMRAGRMNTFDATERAGSAPGLFLSTTSATINSPFSLSPALKSSSLRFPRVQVSTFPCTQISLPGLSKVQRSSSIASVRMSVKEFGSTAGKQALFLTAAAQLIDSVETFIFDCDGVLWSSNKLLDGVKETINLLRSKGKQLYFLTNNSTKSRRDCLKKAESLGLALSEKEMFSSGFAAVLYLKSINFPATKKVYLISESGLQEEFEQAGISYISGSDDDGKKVDFEPGNFVKHDHNVGAVVVGFDRNISYYKMHYAALCLRENMDCIFIATNCDEVIMPTGVQGWPGESAMVGAIRGVTKKEPIIVGKPSTFMMDYLCNRFNINTDQICMVGDNLETDILFGKNGGCKTLLVLTANRRFQETSIQQKLEKLGSEIAVDVPPDGLIMQRSFCQRVRVTDLKTLQSPENSIQPDYYTYQVHCKLASSNSLMVRAFDLPRSETRLYPWWEQGGLGEHRWEVVTPSMCVTGIQCA